MCACDQYFWYKILYIHLHLSDAIQSSLQKQCKLTKWCLRDLLESQVKQGFGGARGCYYRETGQSFRPFVKIYYHNFIKFGATGYCAHVNVLVSHQQLMCCILHTISFWESQKWKKTMISLSPWSWWRPPGLKSCFWYVNKYIVYVEHMRCLHGLGLNMKWHWDIY